MNTLELRIHGDNIIECERGVRLVAEALGAAPQLSAGSAVFRPTYELFDKDKLLATAELLAGFGRWGVDVAGRLKELGAPLREAPDALVTEVRPEGEIVIVAAEFCSALPAGNNAWQRNGRAFALATLGIPYLYIADVGGVELDANRAIKAPRLPNPLITFSYATISQTYDVVCLPVYEASPSSFPVLREQFVESFGRNEAVQLVRALLLDEDTQEPIAILRVKALTMTRTLASLRKRNDTLRDEQWTELLAVEGGHAKIVWLATNPVAWSRKSSEKVLVTDEFSEILECIKELGPYSPGARDLPLCVLSEDVRPHLRECLESVYADLLSDEFLNWVEGEGGLVVVWITGFKPKGDDSRPDRGLPPLARMLFGDDADVMTIVYGPGRPGMYEALKNNPAAVSASNGLWEAIFNLSDAVLVDGVNSGVGPLSYLPSRPSPVPRETVVLPRSEGMPAYSEHDVDTALHILLGTVSADVFESMCNPPGGDWSGISLLLDDKEVRWTSLPRVSGPRTKRPDHVFQFFTLAPPFLLIVESKTRATDLETDVGPNMIRYVKTLFASTPTIIRNRDAEWDHHSESFTLGDLTHLSAGAFVWSTETQLISALKGGRLDIALGFQFRGVEKKTILHIASKPTARQAVGSIVKIIEKRKLRVEVQIH